MQHVKPTEVMRHLLNRGLDRRFRGDIDGDGMGGTAGVRDQINRFLRGDHVDIRDRDKRPARRHDLCRGATDP